MSAQHECQSCGYGFPDPASLQAHEGDGCPEGLPVSVRDLLDVMTGPVHVPAHDVRPCEEWGEHQLNTRHTRGECPVQATS